MSLPRLGDNLKRLGRARKADRPSPWLDGFPCEIVDYGAMQIRLWLPEPPSSNDWWRMYRGRMVKSPLARDYQERVQEHLRRRRIFVKWKRVALFPHQPLAVTLIWYRSRKSGDLDKRAGIILDALQESVYTRDSQIVQLHAERRDQADISGRIDITVKVA